MVAGGALGSAPQTSGPAVAAERRRAGARPRRAIGATPRRCAFDNGFGGLTADGDYEIRVRGDRLPPAPWANVIANPHGGFVVTERGGGFTWAENSYFYRLTPWHNDPVSDPASEVLYLRDDETGELWSATPAPVRSDARVHRAARRRASRPSSIEHDGIATAAHARHGGGRAGQARRCCGSTNASERRPRRIAVTTYVEWTLGVLREHTQHQVHTTFDAEPGAIFARNTFDPQFAGWIAFHAR